MQNKITTSEKVTRFTLLEQAVRERERVALDGIDRLSFTAKCFIVLESIGLLVVLGAALHLMAA